MGLYNKILNIETGIVDAIWTAMQSNINGVVMDDRVKQGEMTPPYIRIFEEPSLIDDETLANTEIWSLNIIIMAVIANYEDEALKAKELAIDASIALRADRTLGGRTLDIMRTQWIPAYTREIPSAQFFGAAVAMQVQFSNKEE